MSLKSIKEANFENASVLVRVDFNVEFNNIGEVQEHFRFDIVKKTIDFIAQFPGVKIALATHLGRPEGKDTEYSVEKLIPAVKQALGREVIFVPDCIGEGVNTALANLEENQILLLENVRFYAEEESNDMNFAKQLSAPFSFFVNEAFSACHRAHASVVGVAMCIPAYAGLRLLQEVDTLDRIMTVPEHPAIAVIGGAKIETKLPLIQAFEKSFDAVLVGGKIANEAIDQKIAFSEKVLLPKDFESSMRLDIGPTTIGFYIQMIKIAKTIVWNGPMGKFEEKPYDMGTNAILNAILESSAYVVIGGGESL
ncbi:MAG TPA: hypothetical protein DHV33_02235, partial [Candidatus Moranbacteria bacterium]|nr:hypothetical protein [Candidatus Moranbacteria bacterium]